MPGNDASLTIARSTASGWTILDVDGDLDMASAPDLGKAVAETADVGSGPHRFALDLEGVGFIDSSGLRTLLTVRKEIDATFVLVNPSSAVTDLLDLTLLNDAFTVVEDLNALDSI